MTPDTQAIDPHIASEVLWHFGHGGYEPGSFVQALLTAMARADLKNFTKLQMVFPGYGSAMSLAMHRSDGIDALRAIAGTRP